MSSEACKKDVLQVVVLADDFSKCLKPLPEMYPSIMTPIINEPLLDYLIESLRRCWIEEVFLYCSNHVDMLKQYIKDKSYRNIKINLIVSDGCRSLGDALRDIYAKGWIRGYFILIRGDAFFNFTDLIPLFDEYRLKAEKDKRMAMTILLRNYGSLEDSLLKEELSILISDKSNNAILRYSKLKKSEKKIQFPLKWFEDRDVQVNTCFVDTHIYFCSPTVLPLFADNFDFQTMDDFVRGVATNEEILDARVYWQQLNMENYALSITSWKAYHLLIQDILHRNTCPFTPDTFPSPRNFISLPRNIFKHKTVSLAKVTVEKDCVLGRNSTFGSSTELTRTIIWRNCTIGSNVNLRNSYIFPNVKIEDNCTIESSIVFPDCIIRCNSQIDGCILHPGIDVAPSSHYVDEIVESASSKIKMSDIDVNGEAFLYFKKKSEVSDSDDSDSTESSIGENNTECISPMPDDTNMFLSEVIDSLLRGYQDKLKCENLILEINSSRHAYNITAREVTYNVIKAILSLPLHYLFETETALTNESYQKNLKVIITYFNAVILNYVKNDDGQDDCLRALEDVASTTDELLPYTQHLLHQFYNRDILSEEKILEWYERTSEDALHNKVRNAVQPFIKWLREAEEDSESD